MMKTIDVASHISALLYQHEAVIIPDLGSIVSEYKAASIDYVQGLLHPPSKVLRFDKVLTINDGVLVAHIQEEHDITVQEARKLIKDFVKNTQQALDKREIVVFPKVGRLYRDYEDNLQFLQDSTNFNTSVFALPSVQFYPILRAKEAILTEAPLPKRPSRIKKAKASMTSQFLRNSMPIALGVALLASAIGFLYLNKGQVKADFGFKKVPVSETRVNTKPTRDEAGFFTSPNQEDNIPVITDNPEVIASQPSKKPSYKTIPMPSVDTEGSTAAPNQKVCVVIIGQFSKKSGVRKRAEQLFELGFDAYQDKNPKNGLTRVGAQFSYDDYSEVRRKLAILRKEFDKSSWILKE